jgi:hypothetical protein
MADWRLDQIRHLHGQKLVRKPYRRYSETWDHDHCAACSAKFSELDDPSHQHEGYATGPDYPKGPEYEWICIRCFDELKDETRWTAEREQAHATWSGWYRRLSSKWRRALWVYGPGAFLTAMLLLYDIYDSGGFQRSHTAADLLILASIYVATILLWPIVVLLGLLQLAGLLPMPITFG